MRAAIVWATLLWFFKVPISKDRSSFFGHVRPWMFPATIATLAGAVATVYTWPWYVLRALEFIAGVCIVVIFIVGLMYLADKFEKQAKWAVAIILFPIWGPVIGVLFVIDLFYEHVLKPYGPGVAKWFFTRKYFKVTYPWSVTAAVLVVVATVAFGPYPVLVLLAGVALLGAMIAGLAVGVWYVFWPKGLAVGPKIAHRVEQHFAEKPTSAQLAQPDRPSPILEAIKLAWAFIVAKKRKICPLIDLPNQPIPSPELAPQT